MPNELTSPSGLLLIDKPQGITSHGVVARIRKTLGTPKVGHGGTLDPMATGLLPVLVGSCTKLASHITFADKEYEAEVHFGIATDTLDAEGRILEQVALSPELLEALDHSHNAPGGDFLWDEALELERTRKLQVPPDFAAIKQGGVKAYTLARKGQKLDLPPRPVEVRSLELLSSSVEPPRLRFRLDVSKGYYVRSFARDLGCALGFPAHLSALRRTRSGPYRVFQALSLTSSRESLLAAMVPTEQVARNHLPTSLLTKAGALKAVFGQPLTFDDFLQLPSASVGAWFLEDGRLVAIGHIVDDRPVTQKVFAHGSAEVE